MTSTIEGGDKGQNFYQKLPTKWYEDCRNWGKGCKKIGKKNGCTLWMAPHLLLIVRSCSTSFIHLVTRLSSMKSVGRGAPKNSEVYSSSRKLNTMTHSELKTYNLFKNE